MWTKLDFEPSGNSFIFHNQKENCHHDYIPFNLRGNGNIVFSVHTTVAKEGKKKGKKRVTMRREGICNAAVNTIAMHSGELGGLWGRQCPLCYNKHIHNMYPLYPRVKRELWGKNAMRRRNWGDYGENNPIRRGNWG